MITDESIGFIDRNKEKPFFLFAAYTAPHFPLQAPDEDIEPFKNKGLPEGTEIVYGMIRRMDTGIGKIVEKLKSEGIYDNTMIVFTSDNGPRFGPWQGLDQKRFNWNLAGQKGLILDGGVKVPTIIRWPMDMKFNNPTYPYLMHGVDWYPTLCNIARADMPDDLDIDGIDFTQYLLGKSAPPSELKRFWTYNKVRPTYKSNSAMRQGGWKLHRPSIAEFDRWDQPAYLAFPDTIPDYQLFNIYSDPFEANDLSAQYPEKKAKMVEEFEAWYKRIMNEHDEINSQR